MIHRTMIEPDVADVMQRRITEAVVCLYRRSQLAGDEGRLFIVKRMHSAGYMLEIGLVRTNDADAIASIMKWRDLFHEDIHEFNEREILALFEAT